MKNVRLSDLLEGLWVPTKPEDMGGDDPEDDERDGPGLDANLAGDEVGSYFLTTGRYIPLKRVMESGAPLMPWGGNGPVSAAGTVSANIPKVPVPIGASAKVPRKGGTDQMQDVTAKDEE